MNNGICMHVHVCGCLQNSACKYLECLLLSRPSLNGEGQPVVLFACTVIGSDYYYTCTCTFLLVAVQQPGAYTCT